MSDSYKAIMVAREPGALAKLRSAHQQVEGGWTLELVDTPELLRERLEGGGYAAAIVDHADIGMNAIDFLDSLWLSHPELIRVLCHPAPNEEITLRCVWNSHRIFTQPLEAEGLLQLLHRAGKLQRWVGRKSLQQRVSRMRTFPVIPTLYFKVLREMESPDVSTDRLARIISGDMAITTKILQVVNSASQARQRTITDLDEAIQQLGLNTVKSLVLSLHAVTERDHVKPLYFSADRIWKHGLAVGIRARECMRTQGGDETQAEEAYMAGMLHDIGKLILAANFDEQYYGSVALARNRRIPLHQVEAELFGVSHAAVAAYMVALWGLPESVVEAIALHHTPGQSESGGFSVLTAVHMANCAEHAAHPDKDEPCPAVPDLAYLAGLGLEPSTDGTLAPLTAAPSPASAPVASVAEAETEDVPPSTPPWTRWVAYGMAAAAGVALLCWVGMRVVALARS